MKVLGATVLVLLCTMALCSSEPDYYRIAGIPVTCCFSFLSQRIPRRHIIDYFVTGSNCATPGVVFVTKRGRQLCAEPSNAWVQKLIRSVKETS